LPLRPRRCGGPGHPDQGVSWPQPAPSRRSYHRIGPRDGGCTAPNATPHWLAPESGCEAPRGAGGQPRACQGHRPKGTGPTPGPLAPATHLTGPHQPRRPASAQPASTQVGTKPRRAIPGDASARTWAPCHFFALGGWNTTLQALRAVLPSRSISANSLTLSTYLQGTQSETWLNPWSCILLHHFRCARSFARDVLGHNAIPQLLWRYCTRQFQIKSSVQCVCNL
jgi:hypothetical protein